MDLYKRQKYLLFDYRHLNVLDTPLWENIYQSVYFFFRLCFSPSGQTPLLSEYFDREQCRFVHEALQQNFLCYALISGLIIITSSLSDSVSDALKGTIFG